MPDCLTADHVRLMARAFTTGKSITIATPEDARLAEELHKLGLFAVSLTRPSDGLGVGYVLSKLGKVVLRLVVDSELRGREFWRHRALGDAACEVFARSIPHADASAAAAVNGKRHKERREAEVAMALIDAATELLTTANEERERGKGKGEA